MGAVVLGPKTIRDFLVNRARAFIYATAPSPIVAAAVRAALNVCRTQPERREKLHRLIAFTANELQSKTRYKSSGSQILAYRRRGGCVGCRTCIGDESARLRHSRYPAAHSAGRHGTTAAHNYTQHG